MKPEPTTRSPATHNPAASRRSEASRPPYNLGLHKLVEGKQAWAEPLSEEAKAQGFLGWHQRGYLPHCDFPGVTQLVTLRLQDSMPATRRSEWEALLRLENNRERRIKLEAYLDRGFGECLFKRPAIATLAENAVRFFDGQRYRLQAWVIMPNHIHVLMEIWQTPLAEIDKSWKQFIARQANRLLGREGSLWEREYWDTVIENEARRRKAVRYIEANPVKALFVRAVKDWPWSSARFRNEYGELGAPAAPPA